MPETRSPRVSVAPGHDDDVRLARLLRKILLVCWVAPPLFVGLIALVAPQTLPHAFWGLAAMPVAGVVHGLLRRGRVRAGAAVVVFGFWGLIFTGALIGAGVRGPGYCGFMLVIPMAGLLLGARAGLLATGLSVAGGAVLLALESQGWLPPAVLPDGLVYWLVSALYFVTTAAVVLWAVRAIRDATLRIQRNESALAEGNDRLRLALDAARMATWSWSVGSDELRWSDSTPALLGVPADRLPSSLAAYTALIHPDDLPAFRATVDAGLRGARALDLEHRLVLPDGRIRWVSCSGRAQLDEDETPTGMIGTLSDVTARKVLEERLLQAQKLEAIGRLAGGVAHDFNNALTAVAGYAELAERELPPEHPARLSLLEISRAASRASDTTKSLLAFARKQRVHPRVVDVNALVGNMQRLLERLIGASVRLELALSPEAPRCRIDPAQLEQVVVNLALNARDAMPAGGTLRIATQAVGDALTLSVSDTGVGMDAETLAHVFEPFFTTKRIGEGTGLGLATCHGVIEQAGGRITVQSRPGAGTCFTIVLPTTTDRPDAPAAAPPTPAPRGREAILVVEDEPTVRLLVERTLRDQGYGVEAVGSAEEALALAETEGARFDLLLTDMVLPGLNGRALAERLSARQPTLKILFMSGYSDEPVSTGPGGPSLLPKPFTPSQLSQRVRGTLDARPS